MKKGIMTMIIITAVFLLVITGIFIGRLTSDGTIRIHTRNSIRDELVDEETVYSGLININTADSAELQELPGIGESTAEAIIAYRKDNGPFKKKKDILKVKGIGEKTYKDIKDMITVDDE